MHYASALAGALVLVSVGVCPGQGAPRSRDSHGTTYDQKQTGEYNIQLHLKDFQIIAVVGEDSLGMGDYDYNYDYAEFTVKPPLNLTQKPTDFESISILANSTMNLQPISTNTTASTTKKPYTHYVPTSTTRKPTKTTKPSVNQKPALSTTTKTPIQHEPTSAKPASSEKPSSTTTVKPTEPSSTSSIENLQPSSTKAPDSSDKIPVAIHDDNDTPSISDIVSYNLRKDDEKKESNEVQRNPVTNVAIVPAEEMGGGVFEDEPDQGDQLTLGEIMQYRRCALGYARDKRGRCRKIRRPVQAPQLPLGITRFASNLAARFRQATSSPSDHLPHSSSESIEPQQQQNSENGPSID